MAVEDEITWFDANRAFIASQYQGRYILIKGHAVRGAFTTYADAVKAGIAQFGAQGGFGIKQALSEEPVRKIGTWVL